MSGPRNAGITAGICLGIALFIAAILIGVSFSYVEYDEIAFKKNTIKNVVDTTTVYKPGRYFWGVGNKAVTFKRTFQQLNLDDLFCFTSSGIEVKINVALQWRYTESTLELSYSQYGLDLSDSVEAIAISAIKNEAPNWDTDQFFQNRSEIGASFDAVVKSQVNASLYVEVGYLQLLDIALTNDDQIQRYLDAANQIQSNEREQFVQNSTLIRTTTANLQSRALANITVIQAGAAAQVQVALETARAQAKLIETEARKAALTDLFLALNLTTTELKLNYLYITSMGTRADNGLKTKFLTDLPVNLLSVTP
jgi:regulator of protease activity HflC (stomatin/prohibitin superfamily)